MRRNGHAKPEAAPTRIQPLSHKTRGAGVWPAGRDESQPDAPGSDQWKRLASPPGSHFFTDPRCLDRERQSTPQTVPTASSGELGKTVRFKPRLSAAARGETLCSPVIPQRRPRIGWRPGTALRGRCCIAREHQRRCGRYSDRSARL